MNTTALNTTSSDAMTAPPSLETLVASMSTGIAVIDALVCMLLTLFVQQLVGILQGSGETSLFSKLCDWIFARSDKNEITRVIEITQRFNEYGNKLWDYEQKNHLLQKAISLYLSDIIDLRNKDANYDLMEGSKNKKKKQSRVGGNAKCFDNDSCDDDTSVSSFSDDGSEEDDDAYYGAVDKLNVEVMPPVNTWVTVMKDVQFMHEVTAPADSGESKGPREAKVRFIFTSSAPNGSELIDTFINTAYSKYQEDERKKYVQDKSRYFYIQSGSKGTSESETSTVAYKRYALGEEKTFDNLFFEEKEQVLQLLDNFTNKSGKFAIKGFPYKLGLLLHGPPGTGKTSLIKAVAQYTKRHIVTISLGKIKTNQELLDALFDMKFAVHGIDTPVEMNFEDVVFVMEDIDCASSIVNARGADDTSGMSDKDKRMLSSQKKAMEKDDDDLDRIMDGIIGPSMKPKEKSDKLNLSGLLNVLDGVIDCPGRIVIMTTNHPEKLDPALVRPGRVNKKLLLSYMGATQIQQMIEYYCATTFTAEAAARLADFVASSTKKFTPAEVEEACAEFDDVDAILNGLAKQAAAMTLPSRKPTQVLASLPEGNLPHFQVDTGAFLRMSYLLPHLQSGWAVDQAILNEGDRVVVIRFGHDHDPTCMQMDEVLCGVAEDVKNFAVIYVVDITQVPDFNTMYELYDPCTVMFFFRNKHIMIDLGTGNNNKINWAFNNKHEMIDIIETVYRGARKGRGLVISPKDYSTKYRY